MTEPRAHLPPVDDELWSLTEAMVDGAATAADRDRLQTRLRAESHARLFYVTYLDLHAQLQWQTRGASAPAGSARRPAARPRRILAWPLRVALAASLLVGFGLLAAVLLSRHSSDEGVTPDLPDAPAGSVAVLIDNSNTVWEKDMTLPTGSGSALSPGRLKLKSGVVEIAFHGGGEVRLEGPADLDVKASDQAYLHRGKLTAKVPQGAPAFRVGMPGVVVTDLIGECGLLSDEAGRSEVHVFAGQVGADPTDRQGERLPGVRLAEKAGARLDAAQQTLTPVPLDEQAFAHLRPEVRIADASVRGGQFIGRNWGAASRLMVKNSIPDFCWESYLRFDLSGIKGHVTEARLRLFPVYVGQPFENAAAIVHDNFWGETTICWDNKPASDSPFATWTVRQDEPVDLDVTPFVREALAGDKNLSLRLFAPNYERRKSFVQYGSRKGEAETRPQLFLTTVP
jgi:hypothetical protein